MKKIYIYSGRLMLLSLFTLICTVIYAQTGSVSGQVVDETGKPVSYASITIKGGTRGASADENGRFTIPSLANGSYTVVANAVGFAQVEKNVQINGSAVTATFILKRSVVDLAETVVVAYGTRKKTDLTGAVTAVSAKDFQKGSIASSEQLLQGKVAGLQITSGGGSAGGGSRIRIRGGASLNASNNPLIVIDGVPVEGNSIPGNENLLGTINPNDIESMSVLKDASATALYGSRASNGVIIITTKKGAKGKLKFNYNALASVGSISKYVDVLSADEIRKIITDDAAATNMDTYKKKLGTANTNWQKEIYQAAPGFDNSISASGTMAKVLPFRASLGYTNQAGVLKTNKFDRIVSSLNLTPKFFDDHLSVNAAMKYSFAHNRFADEGAIGNAVNFDPTQPVYSKGGNKYGGYFQWLQSDGNPVNTTGGSIAPNPLDLLMLRNDNSYTNRFIGNVQLDYKLHFFPDLHVRMNLGGDFTSTWGDNNVDSTSVSWWQKKGRFSHYEQKKKNYLADVSLFYSKDIKSINSKIDVLLLHSYQDFITEVANFPIYSQTGKIDSTTIPEFKTDKPENRLESYLGSINYSFANKYLLTASLRRDASSKFSADNRVGYFPALAAAWKLKDEFFKGNNIISDLKLRLGWGVTGQQDGIANYSYLPRYTQSRSTAQYQFGTTFYYFYRPVAYDKDLKWETTTTTNAGLDFAFLQNRISGSIDIYKKKTKDLLSIVPVAPGANFDIALLTNVGNMENKGIEFVLNTTPIKKNDLTWDFGFNITYNKTKITNLLKNQDPAFKGIDVSGISGGTANKVGKFMVGYAPHTFYMYKQVYDKATGNPIEGLYEDINRDGKIDDADRYYAQKPAPDMLLGINTQLTYRKFTVGLAAHGATGNYLYNNYKSNSNSLRNMKDPLLIIRNVSSDYNTTHFANNQYLSDYFIENASYLRLDNINLGYNVGKIWNDKALVRLTASVQNVFVITKYTGLDPESSVTEGTDNTIYPRPRVYSLGVNLDF